MNSEKFGNIHYADIHMWKYSYVVCVVETFFIIFMYISQVFIYSKISIALF